MKANFMILEFNVQCIVRPAPAENPIIPILLVSMPHFAAFFTIILYAVSASCNWLDRSSCGGGGAVVVVPFEESVGGVKRGRFIQALKLSSGSAVGYSRYLSTNAVTPFAASASATSHPSFPIESHRKPPPGATITTVPFAVPCFGKKGVSVAAVILRAIGSPHCLNHDSEAG